MGLKLVKMFFIGVIVLMLCSLDACYLSPPEPKICQCAYQNSMTGIYYYGAGRSRVAAMRQAQENCSEGPMNWNCYFRFCTPDHHP